MPYYDEIFKHVTGEFPYALAALVLKTPEVEVGKRLATEQPTVPPDFFQDPILEEIMQESPFYEHVIQRGMERGMERGARDATIENMLVVLRARFPTADVNAVKPRLEAIADLNRLKELSLEASIAESFNAFREGLDT